MLKILFKTGLFCGIGLSMIHILTVDIRLNFVISNNEILNLLTVAIAAYWGIGNYLSSPTRGDYNYVKGIVIGITISAIGVIVSNAYIYIRYTLIQGIEVNQTQTFFFFMLCVIICSLIPLKFISSKN